MSTFGASLKLRMKTILISASCTLYYVYMHMFDHISMVTELHYENYRRQQMETRKRGEPNLKVIELDIL